MKMANQRFGVFVCALLSVILTASGVAYAQARPTDAVLTEARQAYDATDYERALGLLDSVIAGLGGNPATPDLRQVLVAAYELRARTRINLRNPDGARTDFRALLLLDPSYLLSAQVGPRVAPIFEEVKKTTVGSISVLVTPADAQVTVDDTKIATEVKAMNLVGGLHNISALRTGYKATTQQFAVVPGTEQQVITLVLERVSSNLAIITSPANITVLVDGVTRGVTELDAEGKAADGGLLSKRFIITDLPNGRHKVEFKRECFLSSEQDFDVEKPSDYKIEAVKLTPAVATVTVNGTAPGATVFVDDTPRGPVPTTLDDICQGAHIFEVRTSFGRHVKRMDLKAGQRESFQANIRPAFALITDSGAQAGIRGGQDLRLAAENAFAESSTITLFAPPEKVAADVLSADSLPADWLWFDMLRRPQGAAATIAEQARGIFAAGIARKLNAQGVAAVAREPGGDQAAMLLILMAPGSTEPDVFKWRLDNPQSTRDTLRELDQVPPLFRASIGVLGIDVEDIDGVVVAAVDRAGGAELAGVKAGEIITGVNGAPVRGAVDLLGSIRTKAAGEKVSLDLKDRSGMARKIDVAIQSVPNVVSLADKDLPANKLLLEYGYRTSALANALEETAVRLNVAALSLRLKNRAAALQELKRVVDVVAEGRIPQPLSDSIGGTAQYLTGLAAEESGDSRGAEAAWRQAAQSQGTLLI